MLRFTFVLALAVCVSGEDLLAVTRLFTISRVTSTIMMTETSVTSIYPTCTTASVSDACPDLASARSFNFEILSPSKPEEIAMTAAPGLARIDHPIEYEEEESFEFGELVFSSQDSSDCFVPKERGLFDFVTFVTSTTDTTTEISTETVTASTVSIIYAPCIPSDALVVPECT